MNEMERRVESLESELRAHSHEYRSDKKSIKVAAVVAVVLTVSFFGFTYWETGKIIRETVQKLLTDPVIKVLIEEAENGVKKISEFEQTAENLVGKLQSLVEQNKSYSPSKFIYPVNLNDLKSQNEGCDEWNKWSELGCISAAHRYCRSEHSAVGGIFQEFDDRLNQFVVVCIY